MYYPTRLMHFKYLRTCEKHYQPYNRLGGLAFQTAVCTHCTCMGLVHDTLPVGMVLYTQQS